MKINKVVLGLVLTLAMLSGCSSTAEKKDNLVDETGNATSHSASTQGYSDQSSLQGEQFSTSAIDDEDEFGTNRLGPEFKDPNNPLSKNVIYFMFDSSQVKQDFIPVIAAHAYYLANHPEQRVILAGHADERGSREYNIALGEQRAKAVYRLMKLQGVADNQLEVVSYGEEKPVAEGMDEASWQLNRRVEILYQGQ